jgi:hypothetical protein
MNTTDASLHVRMDTGVKCRLTAAAAQEGRSVAAIIQDAGDLYLPSRSNGYRQYWELAGAALDQDLFEEAALYY